jgi:hypothetical protein
MNFPGLVFVLSFLALSLSAWFGATVLKKRFPLEGDLREDFGTILAATLTLLGLIIGFTFSMAVSRYDQRKNYEEAEANAIGTEYVRADILATADAAKVQALLRDYLDQRIGFYTARDEDQIRKINIRTAQLQTEMWSAVIVPAKVQPTPNTHLVLNGMNDVLNSQGYTQAAWWNRIPVAAWGMMIAIAICSNALIGFAVRTRTPIKPALFILPFIVAISFSLIADIDSPRGGVILVQPENLITLAESLKPR